MRGDLCLALPLHPRSSPSTHTFAHLFRHSCGLLPRPKPASSIPSICAAYPCPRYSSLVGTIAQPQSLHLRSPQSMRTLAHVSRHAWGPLLSPTFASSLLSVDTYLCPRHSSILQPASSISFVGKRFFSCVGRVMRGDFCPATSFVQKTFPLF
jgi:hypothetical protein